MGHCSLSLLYRAAGAPHYEASLEGDCRTCGCSALGIPFAEWERETFTDHNRLRPGSIICSHCLFAFEEANTILAQRVGKEKPQRTRNYSHFVIDGAWIPLSKGDKTEIERLLGTMTHLGKKAAQGWGAVREWEVQRWAADWSIHGDQGQIMRAIPSPDLTAPMYGLRPSYWLPKHQFPCRLPPRKP